MRSPICACSSGNCAALGHGKGRQARRAVGEIERKREERDEGRGGERHDGAPRLRDGAAELRARPVELVGARQQAARDLGLGGGGLLVVDQPAGPLGLDLVELVAIDGERAGGVGELGCRAGRASGSSTAARTAAVMTAKAIHRSMRT